MSVDRAFAAAATGLARLVGRPATFLVVACLCSLGVGLLVARGFPETALNGFNLAISVVSLLLLFLLQHTSNRDGAALQAKLDELLRAIEPASDALIGADRLTEAEIEAMRVG